MEYLLDNAAAASAAAAGSELDYQVKASITSQN